MKKILIVLSVLLVAVTLTACSSDVITDAVDKVEETIEEVKGDLTGIEDDIANLDELLSSADTTIEEVESAVSGINGEVASVRSQLTLIRTEASALEGDLEEEVARLEEELAMLEETLNMLLEEEVSVTAWKERLKQTEIVLMHTNDMHGRVNDDSWAGSMGYATMKNIIDEVRDEYMYSYLISAGDAFHGTTFATLEEGESMVEVMNAVGYDLMTPGNHDFDYGQDRLLELEALADFPLISGNIQYDADDSDMFEPYVIEEFGGVKVGFFGLTSPETTYKTHPDNVIGLNFLNPIDQADAIVQELEPLVDVVVLVAHIGLDESTEFTSEDIATEVDGIDVIIDGHSHHELQEGMMVNGTLILSAGEYNKHLGMVELTVQAGEVIDAEVLLISADDAEMLGFGQDEAVQTIIDDIVAEQDVILGEVVGQTAVVLDGERADVRTGETNLGKLITDAMLDVTDADVAITNGGGIRASIAAGEVTKGDIITVLPFGNIIVTVELTGQEILDTLEYATSSYPDASGKFPHVGGMSFTIDMNQAEGSRVTNLMIDGAPVNLAATYVVATNDFLAAGGDGYEIFAAKTITGEYMGLHEALESMFTVGMDVVLPTDTRITVVEASS